MQGSPLQPVLPARGGGGERGRGNLVSTGNLTTEGRDSRVRSLGVFSSHPWEWTRALRTPAMASCFFCHSLVNPIKPLRPHRRCPGDSRPHNSSLPSSPQSYQQTHQISHSCPAPGTLRGDGLVPSLHAPSLSCCLFVCFSSTKILHRICCISPYVEFSTLISCTLC